MNDDILPPCGRSLSRTHFLRSAGEGTGVLLAGCTSSGGSAVAASEHAVPAARPDAGPAICSGQPRPEKAEGKKQKEEGEVRKKIIDTDLEIHRVEEKEI